MHEDDLDRLLNQARALPVEPSPALMARVLEDALALQPRPVEVTPVSAPRKPGRPGFWAALAAGFGGGGVLAGLGGAAALGLVLGYVDPARMAWLTDGLPSSGVGLELVPTAELFLSEG